MQFLCIDASKRDMTQNNTLAFFSSDQTTIPTEVLKKKEGINASVKRELRTTKSYRPYW